MSNADKLTLVDTVLLSVYFFVDDADLLAAKFVANNTTTGAVYTNGIKNQLVAMIDAAILLIP